ncbi:PHP domain-containing protein [Halonotius terrestris]|uniref:PHP domain-containing protein n=1 Tax=Halonotius terrestris TaxID=2487750 RepID=A0A8J8P9F7_9EURY|nr:PHP domain-containing protein [Halonotius terrestris]TQQ81191.1 PHP domain-containing protein [Halonotius terrestris]
MDQPAADLHVHTTASDGTLTLAELPAAAEADLDWIAVTDHDRIHPDLDAPITTHGGVRIVRGIELKVKTDSQRLDLLGYGVKRTDALTAELDRLQQDRVKRAREIIDCVETRLGVDLALDPQPGIGRPHIARAVEASSAPYDYQETFDDLIADGAPCYVAREITPIDRGIDLLTDACPIVALAHPLRYTDPATALERAADLDAVERYYPYDREVDSGVVDDAIDRHDLLATGGSDAHDRTLGRAGPPESAFAAVRERLRKAVR